jgi:beta-galactosidase GanA
MVQVENETGVYGAVRDFSPAAQKLFDGPVPADLLKALGRSPGTWREVFGRNADEDFYAWSVARFVDQVAAAGKAEYPLPMYVNAALRDPFHHQDPYSYSSGGPTWNVLDIWKAAAPRIDAIGPDIYMRDFAGYSKTLEQYARPDNALFVPETAHNAENARFFFATVGRGGIGFSPFGFDETGYTNYPLGAQKLDDATYEAFARNYRLIEPMMRELARWNLEGKVHGFAESDGVHEQQLTLGRWRVTASFGRPAFGPAAPVGNAPLSGGALIVQLGPDEFLVTAVNARVEFDLADPESDRHPLYASVEEGAYAAGKWTFARTWNGDQTDWGLNFSTAPQVLRVRMADY